MAPPVIRLGVDFGTSNTVAVVRWPDGRGRTLLFDGSPLLPSAVYAEPSGTLVIGRDAVHSARLEPARFEPNPKRRIDDGSVLLGDREVPVVQLMGSVLERVGEEYRRTVGAPPADTTLTCPASWGATRRFVLSEAAAGARLGNVRLVAEPVAAATYFTQVLGREVPIGSAVVVYDFGAGTFDASVVARTGPGFEVLAVDGRDDIGGLDIDQAVVSLIGRTCAERDPAAWQRLMSPSTVEDRRARRLLWDDARVAKERLSRSPTADLNVPLLDAEVHLTRAELEELARPVIEQTIRVTQGVIRWANVPEGRLAGVFLVGGSSRIPLVATLLHRALGSAPVAIEQPETVVAEGSMLAGAATLPKSAAPAPGPATGIRPAIQGLFGPPGSPVSPPGGGRPVSAPPVSGPPVVVVSVPPSSQPVSSPPVSGAPVSGAQGSGAAALPAGARPVGRVVVPGAQPPRAAWSGAQSAGGAAVAPTRPLPMAEAPPAPRPPVYQPPPVRTPRPALRAFTTLLAIL